MSVVVCFFSAVGAAQVASPSPPGPDPFINPAVISSDWAGNPITRIMTSEWHHVGGNTYQLYLTVELGALGPGYFASGSLQLQPGGPVWNPDNVLHLVSGPQGSSITVSPDGRIAVWWRTVSAFPEVCVRVPPAQFNPALALPLLSPYPSNTIGSQLGSSGRYSIYLSDLGTGSILRGELDPSIPSISNTTLAAPANGGLCVAPALLRDSTGQPRCLAYASYVVNGTALTSTLFFTEGVDNDGTPEPVASGNPVSQVGSPAGLGLSGGSWHYCPSSPQHTKVEVTALANTDLRSGSGRIAAFAPIRPAAVNPEFMSVVAIGSPTPGYQIPPVIGDILLLPTMGVVEAGFHDQFTGLAEWAFAGVPLLNLTLSMQLITLDGPQLRIYAANVATLRI